MESLKLRYRVGVDGILHLDVPVGWQDAELEVTVMIEPVKSTTTAETPQGKGWPAGFFEETFGCLKDDPLVIDSEGIFEDWE